MGRAPRRQCRALTGGWWSSHQGRCSRWAQCADPATGGRASGPSTRGHAVPVPAASQARARTGHPESGAVRGQVPGGGPWGAWRGCRGPVVAGSDAVPGAGRRGPPQGGVRPPSPGPARSAGGSRVPSRRGAVVPAPCRVRHGLRRCGQAEEAPAQAGSPGGRGARPGVVRRGPSRVGGVSERLGAVASPPPVPPVGQAGGGRWSVLCPTRRVRRPRCQAEEASAQAGSPGGRGKTSAGWRGAAGRAPGGWSGPVGPGVQALPEAHPAPNKRLQPTPYSLRCAPAFRRG
jgi:hypothetical protein